MTDAIQVIGCSVPAGNGSTATTRFDTPLGWANVERIVIQFPPGPSGNVGVRILYALNPVYPAENGQWFEGDNYSFDFPVTNQQQAGQWALEAFNTDVFAHTIHVNYFYNYLLAESPPGSSGLVSL